MEDVLLAINDILQLAVAIGLFAFVIYLFIYLVCSIRSDIGLQKYLKNLENYGEIDFKYKTREDIK